MDPIPQDRISIQVSLSGYSFIVVGEEGKSISRSGWFSAGKLFTTPEFQRRYGEVRISLLTPKVSLVPASFFDASAARAILEETVRLAPGDAVDFVEVPDQAAVLVYSLSIGEVLSRTLSQTVLDFSGNSARILPEMFFLLEAIGRVGEYNRILASYGDGFLHLVIAQGRHLVLANVFKAADFTTAEYFLFLALKKLQLNPEVSSVWFRTPLSQDEEMSLYRYFKSVERL